MKSKSGAMVLFLGIIVLLFTSRCLAVDTLEPKWLRVWGGGANDWGLSIAIDRARSIYLVGTTESFGVGEDHFLVKYSPEGDTLWEKTWDRGGNDSGRSVAVDPQSAVYVAGDTYSSGGGSYDALLVKRTPEGKILWEKTWGGENSECATAVAVDTEGTVYLVGSISPPARPGDGFVVKYTSQGEILWEKTWGGGLEDYVCTAVVDATGNLYLAGSTYSSRRDRDAFLVKYASEGEILWEKTWGGTSQEGVAAVAVDTEGNVYVVGSVSTPGYREDAFVAKYTPEGQILWDRTWGGEDYEYATAVALDTEGNVYLVGFISPLAGSEDAFVVKYTSQGEILWEKTWGGAECDRASAAVVDATGNLYLAGFTYSYGPAEDAFLLCVSSTVP
ncbi:MAG: hypothetical protein ACE5K3_05725 [bacterium]